MSLNNRNRNYPASSEILNLPTDQFFPFVSQGKFFSYLMRPSVVMSFRSKKI